MLNQMYNNYNRSVRFHARLQGLLEERPSLVVRKLKVEVAHDEADIFVELRHVRDQVFRLVEMSF